MSRIVAHVRSARADAEGNLILTYDATRSDGQGVAAVVGAQISTSTLGPSQINQTIESSARAQFGDEAEGDMVLVVGGCVV